MKAKFEEFNDGNVEIYTVNEDEKLVKKFENASRFGEENTSLERHYGAKSVGTNIDRMIHIQLQRTITIHDVAVIDYRQYDIEKVDHYKKNIPPLTKLTLSLLGTAKEKEFANGEN